MELDDLPKENFSKIAYLVSLQSNDFYFQKVTTSLFVSKKIITLGEVAFIEENDSRIIVNTQQDAI